MILLNVIRAEILKSFQMLWYYKINTFTRSLSMFAFFLGVTLLASGGHFEPKVFSNTLIGYSFAIYTLSMLGDMAWVLNGEIQGGTLEQMYMSVVPFPFLWLARIFSSFLVSTVQIILLWTVCLSFIKLPIIFGWWLFPTVMISFFGLAGFALILGGLTLRFKHTESLVALFYNSLIFLNGSFLPIHQYSFILKKISSFLPGTWGIEILRKLMVEKISFSLESMALDFSLLFLTTVLYLALGWSIFSYFEKKVKQQGSLSHY